jgi:hypothetical protein
VNKHSLFWRFDDDDDDDDSGAVGDGDVHGTCMTKLKT